MSAFCGPPPGMGPAPVWDDDPSDGDEDSSGDAGGSGGQVNAPNPKLPKPYKPPKPKSQIRLRLEALASGPFPVKVRLNVLFEHFLRPWWHLGRFRRDAVNLTTINTLLSKFADHQLPPSYNLPHQDFPLVRYTIEYGPGRVSLWDINGMTYNYKRNMVELERLYADFLNELVGTAEEYKTSFHLGNEGPSTIEGNIKFFYVLAGEW